MNSCDPEAILLSLLDLECRAIPMRAADEILYYIDHNECGLAYDVLIFLVSRKEVILSTEGEKLLRNAARAMRIKYPQLSTD